MNLSLSICYIQIQYSVKVDEQFVVMLILKNISLCVFSPLGKGVSQHMPNQMYRNHAEPLYHILSMLPP